MRSKKKSLRVEIQREDSDIDMDRKVRKSKDAGMQALVKVVPSRDDADDGEGEHNNNAKSIKTKKTCQDRKEAQEGIRVNRTVEEEAYDSEYDIDIDNTEDQEEILTEREKLEERRKNRLKKNKMIRVREEFIYEEDLTEKEREDLKRKEYRYKSNHVGLKIVEAILIPSERESKK